MKPQVWTPHVYQENAVNWVLNCFQREGCSALFLQPGLGKSSITLEVFRRLREAGKAKKMLVVAPLQVARATWPSELYRWLNFNGLTYAVLHGPAKEREIRRDVDVYIINYEGLSWLLNKPTFWQCDMLVFDELTRVKSWSSKRVKLLRPFLPAFRYRLGLTGTPAPNGLEDLFSQIFMLDLGKRLGARKTKFMDHYAEPSTMYSYKRVFKPWAADMIQEKLDDLCFSLKAEDWLKLPTEITNNIYLQLPDALARQYKELKKEAILELQSAKIVTAQTAAVLTTKLRQFLSGTIYIEDKSEVIHNIKFDFLKEFVEDLNAPLLIAYQYRHEAQRLLQTFPSAVVIGGGTPAHKLAAIIKDWNAGKIPILLGHPQSIGHGLNLQGGGNNILFFSLDYNLETYQQIIKRLARQGQRSEHVIVHHLLFSNTIDEHILAVLEGKSNLQQNLLDYLVD